MADDPSEERDDEAVDLDVLELEREAAALEATARARRGLPGARRLMLLQAPLLVLLAVGLIVWGQTAPSATASAAPPRLSLADGHLDPPAANATAAYAYVNLRNDGGSPERLVGGSSPWAGTITLLDAKGAAVPWIEIPAHGSVTLGPGGDRIEFSGLKRVPKKGDTVELDLNFAHSGTEYTFDPVGPASSVSVSGVMDAMKHMGQLPPENGSDG